MTDNEMDEGKTYKVTYKQQSGNYRWYKWEMYATYLGYVPSRVAEVFSLRPLSGTTDIPRENILSVEEVPHHHHKKPKRFKGAIQP